MMTHTVELSPETYQLLQRQATLSNATLNSIIESAVHLQYGYPDSIDAENGQSYPDVDGTTGVNHADTLPSELLAELEQLAFLTDDELWSAAKSKLGSELHERMETLLHKQQSSRLNQGESTEIEELAQRSERAMLIRAKAAVLLKERGHDISSLGPTYTNS